MRAHFDLDPKLIYLNSGTHSVCPRPVQDALTRYQKSFDRNPTLELFKTWGRLWEIQKELSSFFGADPHDLFLRPNVTAALNVFMLGIPLPARSEILTTDLEYGAIVNLCRFRAEQDGLSLRTIHLPTSLEETRKLTPAELAERIVSSLKPETSLLLLSHVMTANGMVMPLEAIARETRRRGILLVVDGAHGPGSVRLDFSKLQDVDFYGGNLHKWMMGPKGTSFGWIAPRNRERLRLTQAGWTNYEVPAPFQAFGEGRLATAQLLMSACHDWAPFLAIHDTLEFWRAQGPERIMKRLGELRQKAEDLFTAELRWPCLSPSHPDLKGPLISFYPPDNLAKLGYELMFRLEREHGLQVATPPVQGRTTLRLSPAIYNTEDELVHAAGILGRMTEG
ncbi:MAG: aminotransferase class V-fold PLP-dependent enzyme [Oligoflexia bacterium]|nr:aminotransferase class V-fold PLP-dependent enzyme [Oligoflexia bacterium]